jgi:hypothetical protein
MEDVMTAEYDSENIFAKILRGDIPSHKVYEDEDCVVIMDVMPESDGHCLVLPKTASRNLLDADPAVLGKLIAITQKVAQAARCAPSMRTAWSFASSTRRPAARRFPPAYPHHSLRRGRAAAQTCGDNGRPGHPLRKRQETRCGAIRPDLKAIPTTSTRSATPMPTAMRWPASRNAANPTDRRAEPQGKRGFGERTGRKQDQPRDNGGDQRRRDRAHKHESLRGLRQAAAEQNAGIAPEIGGEPPGDEDVDERPPAGVD